MIPTMILFGAVFGRWWRTTLIAAAIGWPAMLAATGVIEGPLAEHAWMLLGAGLLGAANAAAGAAVHHAVLFAARGLSLAAGRIGRRGGRGGARP